MTDEDLLKLLALALTGFTAVSIVSWFYLHHVSGLDPRPKGSWVLHMMVVVSTMALLPTLWFEALTLYRVFIDPALPEWTRPVSSILLFILLSIPIYKAATIYRRRRNTDGKRIPPLSFDD